MAPLYEYFCEACGSFDSWRSMREASEPMSCPSCQVKARRVLSPPRLLTGSRAALQVQEQATEPRLMRRSPKESPPTAPRSQRQRCGRPWQLSH